MGKKFAEYSKFDLSEVNKEVLKKWDERSGLYQCTRYIYSGW